MESGNVHSQSRAPKQPGPSRQWNLSVKLQTTSGLEINIFIKVPVGD